MIKAVPYIQTIGGERFKNFITAPFTIDMLYPIFNKKSCDTIFDGWKGKDMLGWHKFTNDEGFILEFYPDYYLVKKIKGNTNYRLALPKDINDFINDMKRFGIEIYWSQWVDDNFEPKEYMDKEEILNYFTDLLTRMGKSHELQ
jgi:hypothetical protein